MVNLSVVLINYLNVSKRESIVSYTERNKLIMINQNHTKWRPFLRAFFLLSFFEGWTINRKLIANSAFFSKLEL